MNHAASDFLVLLFTSSVVKASGFMSFKYNILALGMPFLRHLETAWEETSHNPATTTVPPILSIIFESSIRIYR